MKKSLSIFSLVCIALALSATSAFGQGYQAGYQFGAGIGAAGGFGGFCDPFRDRFFGPVGNFRAFALEQPPYFAQFPPVYYSHIVRRPYGVSPFAAPPGILPVEMAMPAAVSPPEVISNPHFHGNGFERGQIVPGEEVDQVPNEDTPDSLPDQIKDDRPSPSDSTTSVQWQRNPYFSIMLLSSKE